MADRSIYFFNTSEGQTDTYAIGANDWAGDEESVSKLVELKTALGTRTHLLVMSFPQAKAGGRLTLTSFTFNFRLDPGNYKTQRPYHVVMDHEGQIGASGTFKGMEREFGSGLVSEDMKTMEAFTDALLTKLPWKVTVKNNEGAVVLTFPWPADPLFFQAIKKARQVFAD